MTESIPERLLCKKCFKELGGARYSLGIYAAFMCDDCWDKSGYRKEGREGYDYLDAGEYYDEEDAY